VCVVMCYVLMSYMYDYPTRNSAHAYAWDYLWIKTYLFIDLQIKQNKINPKAGPFKNEDANLYSVTIPNNVRRIICSY